MRDLTEASSSERRTIAREFRKSNAGDNMSRDAFDMWLIDNGMVEDPGTSDTKSCAHKGFVQQRNNFRRNLNTWGSGLPSGESFKIEVDKKNNKKYRITAWETAAYGDAKDIGNRVEKYATNKRKYVSSIQRLAVDQIKNDGSSEDLETLLKMIGLVNGYSMVMEKRISDEVKKFNRAVELVEREVERLSIEVDTDVERLSIEVDTEH